MTLRAYRICRKKFAALAFSGEGARREGGRWNEKGTRLVYCAESISLAMLEILVHTPMLPKDMVTIAVTIPDDVAIETWTERDLPTGWAEYPAPHTLKVYGSAWVASNRAAVLRVPSAVVPSETNLLINPNHSDWERCTVGKAQSVSFDTRLRP